MRYSKNIILVFIVLSNLGLWGQTATIKGFIFNTNKEPIHNVSIFSSVATGTSSNLDGSYLLKVPSNKWLTITFSHISHKKTTSTRIKLKSGAIFIYNPLLSIEATHIKEVTVTAKNSAPQEISIPVSLSKVQPGANAGVENLLQLLPGVSSNNELSTQYAVRGGNYDENLVYINEIEVYRPFLIRNGQQEGLSLINPDLIADIYFSAGGFQAKYGDKMASVLQISYKIPAHFSVKAEASFLGASTAVETTSKNQNFTSISGLRYRNNSLLVNSTETITNYKPRYIDLQSYLNYRFNTKFNIGFLGLVSLNKYLTQPISKKTNFGTLQNPIQLTTNYQGQEKSKFNNYSASLKANYRPTNKISLKLIAAVQHNKEEEISDLITQYRISNNENSIQGSPQTYQPLSYLGNQYTKASNHLSALIINLKHIGQYKTNKQILEWGVNYKYEAIKDKLNESEFIDSDNSFISPSNILDSNANITYTTPIIPNYILYAQNTSFTHRIMGYIQEKRQFSIGNINIIANFGLRTHIWKVKHS